MTNSISVKVSYCKGETVKNRRKARAARITAKKIAEKYGLPITRFVHEFVDDGQFLLVRGILG